MSYVTELNENEERKNSFDSDSLTMGRMWRWINEVTSELEDYDISVPISPKLWQYLWANKNVVGHLYEIQYRVKEKTKDTKSSIELSKDPLDEHLWFIIRSDEYDDDFIDAVEDISEKMVFSEIAITSDFKKA